MMNLRKSVKLFTCTFTERLVYFILLFIGAECFSIPLAPTTRLCALVPILRMPLVVVTFCVCLDLIPFVAF